MSDGEASSRCRWAIGQLCYGCISPYHVVVFLLMRRCELAEVLQCFTQPLDLLPLEYLRVVRWRAVLSHTVCEMAAPGGGAAERRLLELRPLLCR